LVDAMPLHARQKNAWSKNNGWMPSSPGANERKMWCAS
jgi:hypothetical protein